MYTVHVGHGTELLVSWFGICNGCALGLGHLSPRLQREARGREGEVDNVLGTDPDGTFVTSATPLLVGGECTLRPCVVFRLVVSHK